MTYSSANNNTQLNLLVLDDSTKKIKRISALVFTHILYYTYDKS